MVYDDVWRSGFKKETAAKESVRWIGTQPDDVGNDMLLFHDPTLCLSVCLSVCLPVCLSVCLSVCEMQNGNE